MHHSFACLFTSVPRHCLSLYDVEVRAICHQDGGGVQSRWELIQTSLRGGLKSSLDVRVRQLTN